MINKFLANIYNILEVAYCKQKDKEYRKRFNIHKTARLGYIPHIVFKGNIMIGEYSYFNSGKIYTGKNSFVKIVKWCAIGYHVNIHAISHDSVFSTGPENERRVKEGSITIGDYTWIGSNVFILPGVIIGNNCIIGANAVVTKELPDK